MNEADADRVKRVSERLGTIRQTIAELTDDNTGFAVASVAYLTSIEYAVLQALLRVEKDCLGTNSPEHDSVVPVMHEAIRYALKGYHRYLCDYLKLDQTDVIRRSSAFREVISDICKEKG